MPSQTASRKVVWTVSLVYGIRRPSHTANRFRVVRRPSGSGRERLPEGAMRNRRVWGVAATLALALAAPAARGGGGGPPPQGLLGHVFGGPGKGEAQGPWASDEPRPNAESTRPQAEPPQNAIRKAREDYLRRQKVVDRLVEIALQTNDSALEKKARAL